MAWQNRQVLDRILAEKGSVFHMIGEKCCTFIPRNTAPDGTFTTAMNKIKDLKGELKENAGGSDWWWNDLDGILGTWGARAFEGTVLVILIMISLLVCYIIPILRRWLLQLMFRQRVEAARLQLTLRGVV